jgi:hypothetical protein
MEHDHVISALVDKYSQIAGKLQACEKEIERHKTHLSALSAAIQLYKSDFNVSTIAPKRQYRRNSLFPRGVFTRTVKDILRTAIEPLSSRELTIIAVKRLGVINPSNEILEQLRRALNGSLMQLHKKGKLAVYKDCFPKKWMLLKPQTVASTLSIVSRQDV